MFIRILNVDFKSLQVLYKASSIFLGWCNVGNIKNACYRQNVGGRATWCVNLLEGHALEDGLQIA